MTLRTIRPKCARMEGRLRMTRNAICWSPFILTGLMTLSAFHIAMFAGQRECRRVVVKCDIDPAGRHMAGGTSGSELPVMVIILGMTGITILRRAFVDTVCMAGTTGNICVFANERKCRDTMVKSCIGPGRWFMAGLTLRAKLPAMSIL